MSWPLDPEPPRDVEPDVEPGSRPEHERDLTPAHPVEPEPERQLESAGEPAPEVGDHGADPVREELPFHRLDPNYVPATRLGGIVGSTVLGMLAGTFFGVWPRITDVPEAASFWMRAGAFGFWLALMIQSWVWPTLTYRWTRYRLGDAALEIRRGVLFRSWNAVPRSRIQHTDVSSGPIQRRFGVATLQVHTAGTSNASVSLSGVSQRTAEALRDELMKGLLAREEDGV